MPSNLLKTVGRKKPVHTCLHVFSNAKSNHVLSIVFSLASWGYVDFNSIKNVFVFSAARDPKVSNTKTKPGIYQLYTCIDKSL